jgi:isopenicillin-N N-acyltransferase like protein
MGARIPELPAAQLSSARRSTMRNHFLRIAAMVLLACLALPAAARAATAEKGSLTQVQGLWVLQVEGTPYEMGFQQGSLMKDQIKEVYNIYLKKLVIEDWGKSYLILKDARALHDIRGAILAKSRRMEKFIPEEYIQEMHGLADGAGLPYDDVLLMATHVDFFAILCSGFAAYGPQTADGHVVHGRNLDWAKGGLRDLDKFSTLAVFKPKNGHPFASIIYPGIVGVLTSINDSKVTVELNFSMAKDNSYDGTPILILMRKLAQYSESVPEAIKTIRDAARCAGYNVIVTDGKNDTAALIEFNAKTVAVVEPEKGFVLSTNHFTSKELAGGNMNANFTSPNSVPRYERLGVLMGQYKGKIDAKNSIDILHDSGVKVAGTVQSIILVPGKLNFWVWSRNRKAGDFLPFNLTDLLASKVAGK